MVPGSDEVPTRFPEPAGDVVPTVPSSYGGTGNLSSTESGVVPGSDEALAELGDAERERVKAKGLLP